MDTPRPSSLLTLRLLPLGMIAAAVVMALTLTACEEEKKEVVSGHNDPETTPTMLTRRVETMISDSGIMRYRITSPIWLVFDEAKVPRWTFPEGLKLEKFDDFFRREATVESDSATYFKNDETWRLDGHVRISNISGERFLTNQLFWDQRNRKVYSDSFIHIEQKDRIIEGYGFISNERMTTYSIKRVSGIFPVESLKAGATAVDSVGNPLPQQQQQQPQQQPQTQPQTQPQPQPKQQPQTQPQQQKRKEAVTKQR